MNKPNILFLFSDEHGFRYMGHVPEDEGGEKIDTPNFDRLASTGTVFTDTYCPMPLCTPSRMCTFTGREVRKCGAWDNRVVLRPEIPTIGKTLEENGYETCLVGKYHLGGSNQLGGFKHRPYGDLTGHCGHQFEPDKSEYSRGMEARTVLAGVTGIPESLIQDNIVCSETISSLREHKHKNPDKPYFLCAGFSRPHFPLTSPKRHFEKYWPDGVTEPKVGTDTDTYDHPMTESMRRGFETERIEYDEMMKARAAYFACVSYLDEIIGDLLVRLETDGLLDNTIIIYSSDHGEMAGEHGVWWKNSWHEACTRVPFIISLPEQRKGEMKPAKIKTPVQLIDLFPTLCGLTGIEKPGGLQGIDLSGEITGAGNIPSDRPVFSDALMPRWGEGMEFRMIRLKNFKYIAFRQAPPLMFDLENDPLEQKNLIGSDNPEHIRMKEKLAKIAADTMDFDAAEKERIDRDGNLDSEYKLNVERFCLNAYTMPDGRIVSADDVIYDKNVLAKDYRKVFLT